MLLDIVVPVAITIYQIAVIRSVTHTIAKKFPRAEIKGSLLLEYFSIGFIGKFDELSV